MSLQRCPLGAQHPCQPPYTEEGESGQGQASHQRFWRVGLPKEGHTYLASPGLLCTFW